MTLICYGHFIRQIVFSFVFRNIYERIPVCIVAYLLAKAATGRVL